MFSLQEIIGLFGVIVVMAMLWLFIAVAIQIGGQVLFKTRVSRMASGWSAAVILFLLLVIGCVRSLAV